MEDPKQVVKDLNDELNTLYFDNVSHTEFNPYTLTNTFGGSTDIEIIEFLGIIIWDSENEPRDFDELNNCYTPGLDVYIRQEVNKSIDQLNKLKI